MAKVNFFKSKRAEPQVKETTEEYNVRMLKKLVNDRGNCEMHDDGSRRKRINDNATTETCPVVTNQTSGRSFYKPLAWALAGLGVIAGLVYLVKDGCTGLDQRVENYQIQKEQQRYEQFDKGLKETYNDWEKGTREGRE